MHRGLLGLQPVLEPLAKLELFHSSWWQCYTARTVKKLKIKPQKGKDKRIFCIFA